MTSLPATLITIGWFSHPCLPARRYPLQHPRTTKRSSASTLSVQFPSGPALVLPETFKSFFIYSLTTSAAVFGTDACSTSASIGIPISPTCHEPCISPLSSDATNTQHTLSSVFDELQHLRFTSEPPSADTSIHDHTHPRIPPRPRARARKPHDRTNSVKELPRLHRLLRA